MTSFDLIIIGAGPGGYHSAELASKAGLTVAIFEGREIGGVCLNEGCVPSKSLLYSAKMFDQANHLDSYGITLNGNVTASQEAIIKRKDFVVTRLVRGIKAQLKASNVTVINGYAVIKAKEADKFVVNCNDQDYFSDYLLVASGSSCLVPPIEGLVQQIEKGFVLTNREILNLTVLPEHLAIIGGGVIGLEMACYFSTLNCKVTVIEMLDRIANPIDLQTVQALQKVLAQKNVEFKLGCKVVSFEDGKVNYVEGEVANSVACDKVLLSIGRVANVSGFGLENLNITLARRAIVTDNQMRTNVPNCYAIGDCNGKVMLAHTAYREGEVAVNTICGRPDAIDYTAIPSVIYTFPEVASVGESQQSAQEKCLDYKLVELSLAYSGRYVAENAKVNGFCRVLLSNTTNKLIGMHIFGTYASEFIVVASNLINLNVDLEQIKRLVFPHPTVCEIIHEAVYKF
ncbi:MAG: dihydrolipoyl dehydrogenase [Clostridia bacterium]